MVFTKPFTSALGYKTILEEVSLVATIRKNLYADLATLQKDLDEGFEFYNNHRKQGKLCGRGTLMVTIIDGKRVGKNSVQAEFNLTDTSKKNSKCQVRLELIQFLICPMRLNHRIKSVI